MYMVYVRLIRTVPRSSTVWTILNTYKKKKKVVLDVREWNILEIMYKFFILSILWKPRSINLRDKIFVLHMMEILNRQTTLIVTMDIIKFQVKYILSYK